ncbi:MAG: DUF4974 domain-containing protein [Elusimicrobia bacterium]|nr:DUF4974 domain-containing protein [Elusimicrobiota bacterium]
MTRSLVLSVLVLPVLCLAQEPPAAVLTGEGYENAMAVDRMAELIGSTDAAQGGFESRLAGLETEFRAVTDPLLQARILQRLRLAYALPAELQPAVSPALGDESFSGALAWALRRRLSSVLTATHARDAWAWEEAGHVACALKRLQECLAAFEKAISLGSREPELFIAHARVSQSLGDHRLAFQAAAIARRLDPASKEARALLRAEKGKASASQVPSVLKKPQGAPQVSALDTLVSLNVREAPLTAVLQRLSATTRADFILPETLPQKNVTASLTRTPADAVLRLILADRGLSHHKVGATQTFVILPAGQVPSDPGKGIEDPLLDKRVSVSLRNAPLEGALRQVSRRTGLKFRLAPELKQVATTFFFKNASARDVLAALCMTKGLTYAKDPAAGVYEVRRP